MARIFISLYIFIVFSLVGLSAGLERLIFSSEDSHPNKNYPTLIETAKQQGINVIQLAKNLKLTHRSFPINDIAWSTSDLTLLEQNKALSVLDPNLGEQLYIKLNQHHVLEISLPSREQNNHQFILYSIVFFISLGAVIALWKWPLWRDLSRLQKCVSCVMPNGTLAKSGIGKRSLVYPIAHAINSMQTTISELMQNQKELSSAVAHEFRTPLARLKFAMAMEHSLPKSSRIAMQQDINELERLVQEMLDYASSDTQVPELNLAEIPLKQCCQEVSNHLKNSHLSNINIHIKGDNIVVLADEHFIQRALVNLMVNAGKYAKSQLLITIKECKDTVQISFEDDGNGIEKNLQKKIFSPFYRPDESRNRNQGGAGLGLAIVKRIMDWHQGDCFASASSLGGAKFVLSFPKLTSL